MNQQQEASENISDILAKQNSDKREQEILEGLDNDF